MVCWCVVRMDNRVGFARLKREPERLARQIEEGFLDCVARLVRRSERERKSRATVLGMTVFESAVGVAAKIRCFAKFLDVSRNSMAVGT